MTHPTFSQVFGSPEEHPLDVLCKVLDGEGWEVEINPVEMPVRILKVSAGAGLEDLSFECLFLDEAAALLDEGERSRLGFLRIRCVFPVTPDVSQMGELAKLIGNLNAKVSPGFFSLFGGASVEIFFQISHVFPIHRFRPDVVVEILEISTETLKSAWPFLKSFSLGLASGHETEARLDLTLGPSPWTLEP